MSSSITGQTTAMASLVPPTCGSLPTDGACTDCGAIYIPLPSYDDITRVHQSSIKKNHPIFESTLSMAPSIGLNNAPICRICHQTEEESECILISPCRCMGSMQYIHNTCLLRWLAICTKRSRKPAKCELCQYIFHRHKQFKRHHWRFPKVSRRDTVLHICFLINVFVMIVCAVATVMCFLSDRGQIRKFPSNKATLTTEEVVTLACGVLFFVSFFLAMSLQIRARYTIYQLLVKFIGQNMEWQIFEYDASTDNSKVTADKTLYTTAVNV